MSLVYWIELWVVFASLQRSSEGLDNGVARTPPMGFNSYMASSSYQNEAGLRRVADFFQQYQLQDLGYIYLNTDEGWEQKDRNDHDDTLMWNETLYPSGLPTFIDELHSRGFLFGIYGASSAVTCGVLPGQLYHEVQDAHTYIVDWGVDFLKSDNCASFAMDSSVRFRAMSDALDAVVVARGKEARPIVLSIEPFSMTPDPAQSVEIANTWRTGTDIEGTFDAFMNRADIADKWAPLAGPGGWNDPDMINVRNDLTLGENRLYFGLWAIMKAPLLLSSQLYEMKKEILAIISNRHMIQINQDQLGIAARKIEVDGKPLSWLVGMEDCSSSGEKFYTRQVNRYQTAGPGNVGTRKWALETIAMDRIETTDDSAAAAAAAHNIRLIRNIATDRCLTALEDNESYLSVVGLLPCNKSSVKQQWNFEMGVTTVTSITIRSDQSGGRAALALSDSFLFGRLHGNDAYSVSDAAYGESGLILERVQNQENCTSRWCENYAPQQMWYYSPRDGLLRHSLYTSSMNHLHENDDNGYVLSPKVPTFRHHCLAHVLSEGNVGTKSGTNTEVWGGPLADGSEFVVALINRGNTTEFIKANIGLLLETSGYHKEKRKRLLQNDRQQTIQVQYLLGHDLEGDDAPIINSPVQAQVPPHDVAMYRLSFLPPIK